MNNLQNFYLSKFSVTEYSGGCLDSLIDEELSFSEPVSEYYYFYFVKDGGCTMVIDGEKYEGIPGRDFFIKAGSAFSCYGDKNKKNCIYWIRMKLCADSAEVLKLLKMPCYIDVGDTRIWLSAFHDFLEAYKGQRVIDKFRVNSCIFQRLSEYIIRAKCDTASVERGTDEIIYSVVNFIDRNIEMNPTNDDLVRICHLHPQSFIRSFKKKTGYTPARYIKLKKMEKAKKLIEETDLHFNEIMQRVGYDDAAHFSRLFKRIYGDVPRIYRQKLRSKNV